MCYISNDCLHKLQQKRLIRRTTFFKLLMFQNAKHRICTELLRKRRCLFSFRLFTLFGTAVIRTPCQLFDKTPLQKSIHRELIPKSLFKLFHCRKKVTRFHFQDLSAKGSLRAAVLFRKPIEIASHSQAKINSMDSIVSPSATLQNDHLCDPYFFRETKKAWYRLAYILEALVNLLP